MNYCNHCKQPIKEAENLESLDFNFILPSTLEIILFFQVLNTVLIILGVYLILKR